MIIELFRREHLDTLVLGDTVDDLIQKVSYYRISDVVGWADMAVSILDDDETTMAIMATADVDVDGRTARYVSFILSKHAKERPMWLFRSTLRGIEHMHEAQGIDLIAAEAADARSAQFLERLGFVEHNGVFLHASTTDSSTDAGGGSSRVRRRRRSGSASSDDQQRDLGDRDGRYCDWCVEQRTSGG